MRLVDSGKCGDSLDRTQDGCQSGQVIAAHVEADTAAALAQVSQELTVDAVVTADGSVSGNGLADQTLLNNVLCGLDGCAQEGVGSDTQVQALFVSQLHQLLALPQLNRDHLLGEDVLACFQALLDDGVVSGGNGQVDDHIDGRICADLLGGHSLAAVLFSLGLCSSGIQVRAANQLQNLELTALDIAHVNIADGAAADHGNSDLFHT